MAQVEVSKRAQVATVLQNMQKDDADPTNNVEVIRRLKAQYPQSDWGTVEFSKASQRISNIKGDIKAGRVKLPMPEEAPKAPKVSKVTAMKETLQNLGKNAEIAKVLKYLKEKYDIKMSEGMASNYKSHILKQHVIKKHKPVPVAAQKTKALPKFTTSQDGFSIDEVRGVVEMLKVMDGQKMKRLIDAIIN